MARMSPIDLTAEPPVRRSRQDALYDELRADIVAGIYAVGSPFPTEDRLREVHNVSRYAVREALQRLEDDGFIRRKRGAGSTVVSRTPVNIFRHAVGSREDLLSYAYATRMEWLGSEFIRTNGDLARLLGCDELREWQRLTGVRHEEDGAPLGIVQVYIDSSRATVPANADFEGGPVYVWIEKNCGLVPAGLSQDIRAKNLTAHEAELLDEAPGACALQIIRRYFDPGNVMYMISVNTYRSRDFVYNMRLQLQ